MNRWVSQDEPCHVVASKEVKVMMTAMYASLEIDPYIVLERGPHHHLLLRQAPNEPHHAICTPLLGPGFRVEAACL